MRIKKNKKYFVLFGIVLVLTILFVLIVILFSYLNSMDIGVYGGLTYREDIDEYKDKIISDYDSYLSVVEYYNLDNNVLEEKVFEKNNYLVVVSPGGICTKIDAITGVNISSNVVDITVKDYVTCKDCSDTVSFEVYFVPVGKSIFLGGYDINYVYHTVYDMSCVNS